MAQATTAVLLVNLGTPRSPSPRDVRRYLREFLSDPLVLDMPALARFLLLELVILPFRPRRSALAYQKIWGPEGSPLLVHGRALAQAVAAELGDGLRGRARHALRGARRSARRSAKLAAGRPARLIALPLFPQYSTAATGSALAKLALEHGAHRRPAPARDARRLLRRAGLHRRLRRGRARAARGLRAGFRALQLSRAPGAPDHASCDATGRHCFATPGCCDAIGPANRDCYRAQCFATTRALASELGLASERFATSFQSRLGRTPWIKPYTDLLLPELIARGHRRLAVLCPAFVADCLETLEEIAIRAREQWRSLGGEELLLIPSLNAEPSWVKAVAGWVRKAQAGRLWRTMRGDG